MRRRIVVAQGIQALSECGETRAVELLTDFLHEYQLHKWTESAIRDAVYRYVIERGHAPIQDHTNSPRFGWLPSDNVIIRRYGCTLAHLAKQLYHAPFGYEKADPSLIVEEEERIRHPRTRYYAMVLAEKLLREKGCSAEADVMRQMREEADTSKRTCTRAEVLDAIEEFRIRNGRWPRTGDFGKKGSGLPNTNVVSKYFGIPAAKMLWENGYCDGKSIYSEPKPVEQMIREFRETYLRVKPVRSADYNALRGPGEASRQVVAKAVNNGRYLCWRKLLEALDLPCYEPKPKTMELHIEFELDEGFWEIEPWQYRETESEKRPARRRRGSEQKNT